MAKTFHLEGSVSGFSDIGGDYRFFVENRLDVIQRCHFNGLLYEKEELQIILEHAPRGAVIYDIGSNVGNHTVFMARTLAPEKIYVFEANPHAADILTTNLRLNQVTDVVDAAYLGVGLGSAARTFQLYVKSQNNLGGVRLVNPRKETSEAPEEEPVTVSVVPLDSFLHIPLPGFVKIDVEGMEVQVLEGMARIIGRARPLIFIEVDNVNRAAFEAWLTAQRYEVVTRFKRYQNNENFLIRSLPDPA